MLLDIFTAFNLHNYHIHLNYCVADGEEKKLIKPRATYPKFVSQRLTSSLRL